MGKIIESYRIGKIHVTITESENPEKLNVSCNDGTYRSEFTVRRYEYLYYRRHMNRKITKAYSQAHEEDEDPS